MSLENTGNFEERLNSPNVDLQKTILGHWDLRKKLEHGGPETGGTGTFDVPIDHNSNILPEIRCFQTSLMRPAPWGTCNGGGSTRGRTRDFPGVFGHSAPPFPFSEVSMLLLFPLGAETGIGLGF